MIKREITSTLKQISKEYGVISITGPRQSGKTTLVKSFFKNHEYYNLEQPSTLNFIKTDPVEFINSIKKGVILDEVQKFPEILSYIQVNIDEDYKSAKFVITGSQNLLLSEKVSQSLAGRVGILTLYPLTIHELKNSKLLSNNYFQLILKGFMPPIYDRKLTPKIFYEGYLKTYVERDVRTLKNIENLTAFNKLLQLLAGRVGQIVNLSDLGGILGVSHKTISSWLSILEASYIIFRLEPYYKNLKKRVIKSPKIYFTDVGFAAHLLGLDSVDELKHHFALGGLVENMVILDFYKRKLNTLSSSQLYFYRDKGGHEVDLVIDTGTKLIPIEIKASSTYSGEFLSAIEYFNNTFNQEPSGYLIYNGLPGKTKGIELVQFKDIDKINIE